MAMTAAAVDAADTTVSAKADAMAAAADTMAAAVADVINIDEDSSCHTELEHGRIP